MSSHHYLCCCCCWWRSIFCWTSCTRWRLSLCDRWGLLASFEGEHSCKTFVFLTSSWWFLQSLELRSRGFLFFEAWAPIRGLKLFCFILSLTILLFSFPDFPWCCGLKLMLLFAFAVSGETVSFNFNVFVPDFGKLIVDPTAAYRDLSNWARSWKRNKNN